jgi:hypothetical protein
MTRIKIWACLHLLSRMLSAAFPLLFVGFLSVGVFNFVAPSVHAQQKRAKSDLEASLEFQLKNKNYKQAESTLRELVVASKENPYYFYELARVLDLQEKHKDAEIALLKGLSIVKENPKYKNLNSLFVEALAKLEMGLSKGLSDATQVGKANEVFEQVDALKRKITYLKNYLDADSSQQKSNLDQRKDYQQRLESFKKLLAIQEAVLSKKNENDFSREKAFFLELCVVCPCVAEDDLQNLGSADLRKEVSRMLDAKNETREVTPKIVSQNIDAAFKNAQNLVFELDDQKSKQKSENQKYIQEIDKTLGQFEALTARGVVRPQSAILSELAYLVLHLHKARAKIALKIAPPDLKDEVVKSEILPIYYWTESLIQAGDTEISNSEWSKGVTLLHRTPKLQDVIEKGLRVDFGGTPDWVVKRDLKQGKTPEFTVKRALLYQGAYNENLDQRSRQGLPVVKESFENIVLRLNSRSQRFAQEFAADALSTFSGIHQAFDPTACAQIVKADDKISEKSDGLKKETEETSVAPSKHLGAPEMSPGDLAKLSQFDVREAAPGPSGTLWDNFKNKAKEYLQNKTKGDPKEKGSVFAESQSQFQALFQDKKGLPEPKTPKNKKDSQNQKSTQLRAVLELLNEASLGKRRTAEIILANVLNKGFDSLPETEKKEIIENLKELFQRNSWPIEILSNIEETKRALEKIVKGRSGQDALDIAQDREELRQENTENEVPRESDNKTNFEAISDRLSVESGNDSYDKSKAFAFYRPETAYFYFGVRSYSDFHTGAKRKVQRPAPLDPEPIEFDQTQVKEFGLVKQGVSDTGTLLVPTGARPESVWVNGEDRVSDVRFDPRTGSFKLEAAKNGPVEIEFVTGYAPSSATIAAQTEAVKKFYVTDHNNLEWVKNSREISRAMEASKDAYRRGEISLEDVLKEVTGT